MGCVSRIHHGTYIYIYITLQGRERGPAAVAQFLGLPLAPRRPLILSIAQACRHHSPLNRLRGICFTPVLDTVRIRLPGRVAMAGARAHHRAQFSFSFKL